MAERINRLPQNVAGAYYVDSTCIDCDMCRTTAPDFYKRDDETGLTFVHRQPITLEDRALAEEARQVVRRIPSEMMGLQNSTLIKWVFQNKAADQ